MTRYLLSVDCGLRACGVALFDTGHLISAKLVLGPKTGTGVIAWREMARAVVVEAGTLDCALAIETQQPHAFDQLAVTRALFELQGVAGALAGFWLVSGLVTGYVPHEWKGSLKKDAMVQRIQGRLSVQEKTCVHLPSAKSIQHNVWDGVGVGLFHLGRLTPKQFYAR